MGSVNMAGFLDRLNIPLSGGEAHERKGPRGGRIDNPVYHPENRNRALTAPIVETKEGERIIGLHDPRVEDTTRPGIEREQPWHRMAAHMLNRGFTNIEVADAADVNPGTVSTLRAQRWFNELCAELSSDKEKTIRARLDGYGLEAVEAIHAIATDASVDDKGNPLIPARVKLTAHTTLLEQAIGRPTQKILSVSATTSFSSEREEYDAIMQELQTIRPAIVAEAQPTSGAAGHDENGHSVHSISDLPAPSQ